MFNFSTFNAYCYDLYVHMYVYLMKAKLTAKI